MLQPTSQHSHASSRLNDHSYAISDMHACQETLPGHQMAVTVQAMPLQSLVASGSKDTLIKLWDARAGASALQTLHAHKAPLSSLAWHHNGRWLLSSARDHLVKVAALLCPPAQRPSQAQTACSLTHS